jgi:hypothetical protein
MLIGYSFLKLVIVLPFSLNDHLRAKPSKKWS